ncbi:MAG: hypothetical protein ACXIUM_01140 [Wenzhouxiangella sp.]
MLAFGSAFTRTCPVWLCLIWLQLPLCVAAFAAANDPVQRFVAADGHGPPAHDVQALEDGLFENVLIGDEDSWVLPGADLGPIEKALLITEMVEGALPRTRWIYSLGQIQIDPGTGRMSPLYFVEVMRYNLGPVVHAELLEIVGAEQLASIEEFGSGPSLSWRFVFTTVQNSAAALVAVGRKELASTDLESTDCFDSPCLAGGSIIETIGTWQPGTPELPALASPPYARMASGERRAAWLAHLAQQAAGWTPDGSWYAPERPESISPDDPRPFVRGIIEIGLGNGGGASIAQGEFKVMDTTIRDYWVRIDRFDGQTRGEWSRYVVPRQRD